MDYGMQPNRQANSNKHKILEYFLESVDKLYMVVHNSKLYRVLHMFVLS
ncbi:hypothetical protein MICCA_2090004 [Microcystis aeruginosa PCC 9432]|uniref:Uncharacterized protein n=1 Tax=Microcystis aeruginosa PCC 9432 TaxID=1160280 RepID=A0A822LAH0_MICAE|nr:hypothetical protein MICCA_2090004 [Microcystis aeruginosa PCC 9432]